MRLLIIACSATKRNRAGPAVQVYDGPIYRTLRKRWVRWREWVFILSAEHGLIPATDLIEPYDRRMTPARARELAPGVRKAIKRLSKLDWVDEVYIEVGLDYRPALPNELDQMFQKVIYGEGGIGKRAKALKEWLTCTE